jgi:hypothetical protein
MLTDGSKLSTKQLQKFLGYSNLSLCSRERDGFGWAAVGQSGVFGERYVKPNQFDFRIAKTSRQLPISKKDCNSFGKLSQVSGAVITHGRTSTNNVSLKNTHPFTKNEWTLIHNGVVQHHGDKYDMESTCDTEHLVHNLSTGGVAAIESNITGYYAIGAISPDRKLHVIKDSTAQLNIAWVENIKSYMIGTTTEIMKEVAKGMGWQLSPIDAVEDNVHAIFDGNKLLHSAAISPRGRYGYDSALEASAAKAFGYMDGGRSKVSEQDWQYSDKYYSRSKESLVNPAEDKVTSECQIFMLDGTELDFEDYQELPATEKLKCTIVKPNGDWIGYDGYGG